MDEDLKKLIETTAAETRRHFDIVAEQLRSELKVAIEATSSISRKLEQLDLTTRKGFDRVKAMLRVSD